MEVYFSNVMAVELHINSLIDKLIVVNVDGSKKDETIENEIVNTLLKAISLASESQESSSDKSSLQSCDCNRHRSHE